MRARMQTVDLFNSGRRITALDIHRAYLDQLRTRVPESGCANRVHVVQASMFARPFSDESFERDLGRRIDLHHRIRTRASLAQLNDEYRGDDLALEVIASSHEQIPLYRRFSECYGYVFYVLRLA